MKKVVYIIPGYGETHLKQRSYKKIAQKYIAQGIEPIYVSIDWHKSTPENFDAYLQEFQSQYKKPKNTKVYVLGFSFGAIIAFLTASKTKPNGLILCSLSPYFIEDLPSLKPAWVKWFQDTFTKNTYSFHTYASKIKTRTYIVVGDKEGNECMTRAKQAKKEIKNSKLVVVEGGKHNINQKEYQAAIEKIIKTL